MVADIKMHKMYLEINVINSVFLILKEIIILCFS